MAFNETQGTGDRGVRLGTSQGVPVTENKVGEHFQQPSGPKWRNWQTH